MQKNFFYFIETLAYENSSESTQQELFNDYHTWQGIDGFQKSLRSCALDKNNFSIGRVKMYQYWYWYRFKKHCIIPFHSLKVLLTILPTVK